jgi:hypothetical protein
MFSRIAAVLVLTGAIMFSAMGPVQAQSTSNIGGLKPRPDAVPEFDPSVLGSAIVILAGGLFLLNEHRRKTC